MLNINSIFLNPILSLSSKPSPILCFLFRISYSLCLFLYAYSFLYYVFFISLQFLIFYPLLQILCPLSSIHFQFNICLSTPIPWTIFYILSTAHILKFLSSILYFLISISYYLSLILHPLFCSPNTTSIFIEPLKNFKNILCDFCL